MKVLLVFWGALFISQHAKAASDCARLLDELQNTYAHLLKVRETAFWEQKMAYPHLEEGTFVRANEDYQRWISDSNHLSAVRAALSESEALNSWEKASLQGWEAFFNQTSIDDPKAKDIKTELLKVENALQIARDVDHAYGYWKPNSGVTPEFVKASATELALIRDTDEDEATRKAAYEGLIDLEQTLLHNGFIHNTEKNLVGLIEKRNQFAQARGFKDFYEMKVKMAEGISLEELFTSLDDLEAATRDAGKTYADHIVKIHGPEALKPWNWNKVTSGDLTDKMDPYFDFESSVKRWMLTYSAQGIDFNGATINLDLVDRPGAPGARSKTSNGFAHFPEGSYVDRNGVHHPMLANFSSNAVPGKVGSGLRAANTVHHEGGHSADFANVDAEGPQFSQEYHGTSVPRAEVSSMFQDDALTDPEWLARYATDVDGNPIPEDLIVEQAKLAHQSIAFHLRWILAVSYFEREIYRMPESELRPENLTRLARDLEKKMLFVDASPRPIMSVMHLTADEASGYYHSYALAQAAVYQVKDYFIEKYGYLADNPQIGPEFKNAIWRHGNKQNFFGAIESLTGKPFSAEATRALVSLSEKQLEDQTRAIVRAARAKPRYEGGIKFNATISIVHGDKVITTLPPNGDSVAFFEEFATWVRSLAVKP